MVDTAPICQNSEIGRQHCDETNQTKFKLIDFDLEKLKKANLGNSNLLVFIKRKSVNLMQ